MNIKVGGYSKRRKCVKVKIYIRVGDYDKWKKISNKSRWIHEKLNG